MTKKVSQHGNPCAACPVLPDDLGHCYMFRDEPEDCRLGHRMIEAENFKQAERRMRELRGY
jgi:hypothetical protein